MTCTSSPPIRPRPSPVPADRQGIADQQQAVGWLSRAMSGDIARSTCDPVGDQLDGDVVIEERGQGQTGRTVIEAAHGVEEVQWSSVAPAA